MQIGIIGTSIWQQNMPLLERLTIDRDYCNETLESLKSKLGISELIYLSTCNRVEFIYVSPEKDQGQSILYKLIDFFFKGKDKLSFFPNDFYHYTDKEAISHLFRTVSSLESLVIGETQITGQFKQAYLDAIETGIAGKNLDSLAKEALLVAKNVKRQTKIGNGSLSMASLAAGELVNELKTIEKPTIAIVGSGTMTIKLAKYLNESISANLLFVNRTEEKAKGFAEEFEGSYISLEKFLASPSKVDAIVTATASKEPVFNIDFISRLPKTENKVVCIDLAIPRDFSFECCAQPNVTVIDIPTLKSKGQGNLRQKFVEAGKANEIVRNAVNKYLSSKIETNLKPIFHDSYKESIVRARQAFNDLFDHRVKSLSDEEKEAIHSLVEKLIGHSSFQPVRYLSEHLVSQKSDSKSTNVSEIKRVAV